MPFVLTFSKPGATEALNRYASPMFFGCISVPMQNGNSRWSPKVLYLDASQDFIGERLSARIKKTGSTGGTVANIPAGTWWPSHDSPTFSTDVAAATNGYATLSNRAGKLDIVEIFLARIRSARRP